ncbi:MAG: HAMP domain-containing histidine kinase [Gemmatimonadetes bacterium]|nr:HAMP domain-containing histidine kinase [Gemmatimonadota bacterium]
MRFPRPRRVPPEVVLALVVVLGGVSLWQAWDIAGLLRGEARETSRLFGRVVGGLSDDRPGADTETLLELVREIRERGIPLITTDSAGRPTASANLPFAAGLDDPRVAAYAVELDRVNPPIAGPGKGLIHFGSLPAARRINLLAVLQLCLLVTAVAVGIWAYRTAVRRDRERLWVAMARESAHQLGTPLMSADAWVERLDIGDPGTATIATQLRADLERLHRVAQRFERIGRPARRDRVSLGVLAEKVAAYFTPRLPRHDHPVTIQVRAPASGPVVAGDPVLLEWALEALVRNSVDALSGRGGTIDVSVVTDGGTVELMVSDDGPGVSSEIRATLFEPGVTTKTGGWGIGLALAKRIIEDVHHGRLELRQTSAAAGATFVAELPQGAE